ncbi:hypothetical protein Ciccas_005951 [Cichlidogyrus casuarinus]|uniref:Uncharacterized protein n=1 Tax=Cichlidogyrus casuarinus TaxID=1844966 RepID=A0ABD2Q8B7_9PLAT
MSWCPSLWPEVEFRDLNGTEQIACRFCNQENVDSSRSIVYWDIALAISLAFFSLIANLGLICLAKITTRRGSLKSHVSESSLAAASTLRIRRKSDAGVKTMSTVNDTRTGRRMSSAACLEFHASPPAYNTNKDAFVSGNDEQPAGILKKCTRFRLIQQSFTNIFDSLKNHQPSSRRLLRSAVRNRRYLRGLMVIALSNLTITLCLIMWSVRESLQRLNDCSKFNAWLHTRLLAHIPFFNVLIEDSAQAVEIGAVLWIALERTMAIQWPARRRSSSVTCTSPTSPLLTRSSSTANFDYSKYSNNYQQNEVPACQEQEDPKANKCCTCLGLSSPKRRKLSLASIGRRFSDDPFFPQYSPTSFLFTRKFKSLVRVISAIFPFLLLVATFIASAGYWLERLRHDQEIVVLNNSLTEDFQEQHVKFHFPYFYFNNTILVMLVFGQFLIPFGILLVTSILIYHRVSSHNPLFQYLNRNKIPIQMPNLCALFILTSCFVFFCLSIGAIFNILRRWVIDNISLAGLYRT